MACLPNPAFERSFTFRVALQGFMLDQDLAFAKLLAPETIYGAIGATHVLQFLLA